MDWLLAASVLNYLLVAALFVKRYFDKSIPDGELSKDLFLYIISFPFAIVVLIGVYFLQYSSVISAFLFCLPSFFILVFLIAAIRGQDRSTSVQFFLFLLSFGQEIYRELTTSALPQFVSSTGPGPEHINITMITGLDHSLLAWYFFGGVFVLLGAYAIDAFASRYLHSRQNRFDNYYLGIGVLYPLWMIIRLLLA